MSILSTIKIVSRYEARTLQRSWFFKLFFCFSLLFITFFSLGSFATISDEPWEVMAIPSNIPYMNLFLLNIGQAILVIFLASDFLKRDKKVDTNEVLYTRSMSNLEYIIGKTWGILKLFLLLNVLVLAISLIVSLTNKSVEIDLTSYIEYLIIISLPTLIFSLGLSFMAMSIIKNQAITFLLLLGLAIGNIGWGYYRLDGIMDYMVYGFPLTKSPAIGYDNLNFILSQRGIYLFAGLSMIFATILMFNRLPQSKVHTTLSWIFTFVFAFASIYCFSFFYSSQKSFRLAKEKVIETNKLFEDQLFTSLTDVDIDVHHHGDSITAKANLTFINDNSSPVDEYIFSLNPGLKVSKLIHHGEEVDYDVTNHIVRTRPSNALQTGATDSLTLLYSGTIDESFYHAAYKELLNENTYRIRIASINKHQSFLRKEYVLLIPETHWYPFAGLNYYPSDPSKIKIDFANYTMHVTTTEGLSVISQGIMEKEGDTFSFSPNTPLPGITLAIGEYQTDSITVDSITFIANYFKGHDYYKELFSEISDTLPSLISNYMRDIEIKYTTPYPFSTLNLVEVPIFFRSLPRLGTQTGSELQPSLILLPEKMATMEDSGFASRFKRLKRRYEQNNEIVTDKEIKTGILNDFITNSFIAGYHPKFNDQDPNELTRFCLTPNFYLFKNNFYSDSYPGINFVIESHLQKEIRPEEYDSEATITDVDNANMIFKSYTYSDLLRLNPLGDSLRITTTLKGDYLFGVLRSQIGIQEFDNWFKNYLDVNKFKRIPIERFCSDIEEHFGFDLYQHLDDWYNSKEQPGFQFSDLQASEVVTNNRTRYQVHFVVRNPEQVAGLFYLAFNTAEENSGNNASNSLVNRGRGLEMTGINKVVYLEPHQTKEVGIVLDALPREMVVNTLFSKNLPGDKMFPINNVKRAVRNNTEFIGERIIPDFSTIDNSTIIVDNEDDGFSDDTPVSAESPLKRLFKIQEKQALAYDNMHTVAWAVPGYWQPILKDTNYGKYVMSSVYIRAGSGDKIVSWTAEIKDAGLYDIACYVSKIVDAGASVNEPNSSENRVVITIGNGPGKSEADTDYKDMHYTVYHDDGESETVFDYGNANGGWNSLGKFYLSEGKAKVTLSNLSSGNIVIGDAIRWSKIN